MCVLYAAFVLGLAASAFILAIFFRSSADNLQMMKSLALPAYSIAAEGAGAPLPLTANISLSVVWLRLEHLLTLRGSCCSSGRSRAV